MAGPGVGARIDEARHFVIRDFLAHLADGMAADEAAGGRRRLSRAVGSRSRRVGIGLEDLVPGCIDFLPPAPRS